MQNSTTKKKLEYWCKLALLPVSYIITFMFPFITLGLCTLYIRGTINFVVFVVATLFFPIASIVLKHMAKKVNYGESVPVPRKRFTYIRDGKVMADNTDLMEMIVYISEVEDFLEREGML